MGTTLLLKDSEQDKIFKKRRMHRAMFRYIVLAVILGLSCATTCKQTTRKIIKVYPEKMTWNKSKTFCESQRFLGTGTLVIDDDADTHSFLKAQGKEVWMGGSDRTTEGVWKWLNGVGINTKDATWYGGGPNNNGGVDGQDCMVINYNTDGKWDDQDCTNLVAFACQWLFDTVEGRLVSYQGEKVASGLACSGEDERLITADSEAVNDWLATHNDSLWIGATDLEQEGQWKWANGERLEPEDMINWKKGGPDNLNRIEHCAIFQGDDAKWDDRYCWEQHAAACELKKTSHCV